MSTRCNILVEYRATRIFIYRHHDGYLAATGRDLLRRVREADAAYVRAHAFVQALLSERYEKSDDLVYELTSNWHGDIDYAYRVKFNDFHGGKPTTIGYTDKHGPPTKAIPLTTLDAFEGDVVKQEAEFDQLRRQHAARNNG